MKSLFVHQLTVLLALFIFLSACQKGPQGTSVNQPSTPSAPSAPSTGEKSEPHKEEEAPAIPDVHAQIQITKLTTDLDLYDRNKFQDSLNKYKITVTADEEALRRLKVFVRKDQETELQSFTVLDSKEDGVAVLSGGLQYSRKDNMPQILNFVVQYDDQVILEKQFTIKADLLVRNAQIKAQELGLSPGKHQLGIIYFTADSHLITEGQFYDIDADYLVADKGTIETFTADVADQAAPLGVAGKNGGYISLKLKKATGHLAFKMRGTRGGQGMKGPAQIQNPEVGPTGDSERMGERRVCEPSVKRQAPADVAFPVRECHVETACLRGATAGKQGPQGLKGNPGNPGLQGGTTGKLTLEVENNQMFNYSVERFKGAGGIGGESGEGGAGGRGGPQAEAHFCPRESSGTGPQGPDGVKGDPGSRGDYGVEDQVCVRISKSEQTICI